MENPALGGASGSSLAGDSRNPTPTHRAKQGAIAVIRGRDRTRRVVIAGRQLWALRELLRAGPKGTTPFHNPAPRWSSYVHRLREKGVPIDTIAEAHGGPFAGHHARYVLTGDVSLEPLIEPEAAP